MNPNEGYFKIDELENFKDFLSKEGNQDIIFSAPFGTGKTHFLKNVFAVDTEVLTNYNIIHLFPVNYTVASNDDIFELIKYDILFELKKNCPYSIGGESGNDFGKLLVIQSFLENEFKPLNFLKNLLKKSGLVNKAPFEIYDLFKEEYDRYKEYEKEIETNSEEKTILEFINDIERTIKLKQIDAISNLICEANERIKKQENKSNILIIDDLDRIDPEHIFRIINIFSAHRDYETNMHKFDFDKVILVCDIENIRKIYEHKYGVGVDFTGYISKFISKEIFSYNVKNYLNNALDVVLQNYLYKGIEDYNQLYRNEYLDFSNRALIRNNNYYRLFKFYLNHLIDIGSLNIRDLTKNTLFEFKNRKFYDGSGKEFYSIDYPILVICDYLDTIFGGRKRFFNYLINSNNKGVKLSFINKPSLYEDSRSIIEFFMDELLTLLILPMKNINKTFTILPKNKEGVVYLEKPIDAIELKYTTEIQSGSRIYRVNVDKENIDWTRLFHYNFNELFEKALIYHYDSNPGY